MNYYIQGCAAKADKIKAAFEDKGYDTTGWKFNVEGVYYTHEGRIDLACGKFLINLIKTHPDYKELELPIEFKDGDIIGFNDNTHWVGSYVDWVGIYKRKRDDSLNQKQHLFHCVVTSRGTFRTGDSWRVFTAYPATKEQRDLLFSKMKEAGYEWDDDKKELRKIQPHYDIANLHAGMPVLVRDYNNSQWSYVQFSHLIAERNVGEGGFKFNACGIPYIQCIPFEGNEHLLGTTDMPDEMYINW